jgi:hypothetical protein
MNQWEMQTPIISRGHGLICGILKGGRMAKIIWEGGNGRRVDVEVLRMR